MEDFYLVTCYTPNSQDGLRRLDYRMKWEDDFLQYIKGLDAKKPVIVCGDLNVAHEEIDLKNPKTNRKNAGFTDEERAKMTAFLGEDSSTPSARCTPTPLPTRGGRTASRRARRTRAGASTTSSRPNACASASPVPLYTTRYSAAITARWNLYWIENT